MAVRQGFYRFWGELEGDDITKLPEDVEAKVTDDNKVYFVKYGTNNSQAPFYCVSVSFTAATARKKLNGRIH